MSDKRTYETGHGFVRAVECPDCLHTKCSEECVCNCDAARAEHEAAMLRTKLSALESRCQALETALDRCIGSDGQAGLYALGSLSEASYFERGGNNESTDKCRAMADEIIAAARKARAT